MIIDGSVLFNNNKNINYTNAIYPIADKSSDIMLQANAFQTRLREPRDEKRTNNASEPYSKNVFPQREHI